MTEVQNIGKLWQVSQQQKLFISMLEEHQYILISLHLRNNIVGLEFIKERKLQVVLDMEKTQQHIVKLKQVIQKLDIRSMKGIIFL